MPTANQILGAKIRAANEAYVKKHRRVLEGGFEVPSQTDCYNHLAAKFGMSAVEVSRYLTYSRVCDHPWADGACDDCPDERHNLDHRRVEAPDEEHLSPEHPMNTGCHLTHTVWCASYKADPCTCALAERRALAELRARARELASCAANVAYVIHGTLPEWSAELGGRAHTVLDLLDPKVSG